MVLRLYGFLNALNVAVRILKLKSIMTRMTLKNDMLNIFAKIVVENGVTMD